MDPTYQTVFEISEKGLEWWFPSIGFLFVVVGVLFNWIAKRWYWPPTGKWFAYFWLGFSCFWTLEALGTVTIEYLRLQAAYRTGEYSTVEGVVEDFQPMPWRGQQDECFYVKPKRFCYSDITAGFNNSAAHGGPIRAGLPLRIGYVGGAIVKIEIQKDRVPKASAAGSFEKTRDIDLNGMNLVVGITLVLATGWWNLRWQRFTRFWANPPIRKTLLDFGALFALSFAGTVLFLGLQILRPRLIYLEAFGFAAAWFGVISAMVHFVEWRQRPERT